MAVFGQEFLAWMRVVFFLTFFFAKSTEKSLCTKNHSKLVLWPRAVLFQIWKRSMQICHCQTQICAGGIKKKKRKTKKIRKKISDESIRHRVLRTGCLIIWERFSEVRHLSFLEIHISISKNTCCLVGSRLYFWEYRKFRNREAPIWGYWVLRCVLLASGIMFITNVWPLHWFLTRVDHFQLPSLLSVKAAVCPLIIVMQIRSHLPKSRV